MVQQEVDAQAHSGGGSQRLCEPSEPFSPQLSRHRKSENCGHENEGDVVREVREEHRQRVGEEVADRRRAAKRGKSRDGEAHGEEPERIYPAEPADEDEGLVRGEEEADRDQSQQKCDLSTSIANPWDPAAHARVARASTSDKPTRRREITRAAWIRSSGSTRASRLP